MKSSKRNLTPNILKKKKKMHIQNTDANTTIYQNVRRWRHFHSVNTGTCMSEQTVSSDETGFSLRSQFLHDLCRCFSSVDDVAVGLSASCPRQGQ